MSNRLDKDREAKLTPIRIEKAIKEIEKRGFKVSVILDNELRFEFQGEWVKYFPYSGWASGKTIKDGRGLQNLLKQLA